MEAASGTNLFLTQNPSDAKSPDEEKQCEGNAESAEKGSGGTQENHAEEEKTPVRKKLTKKLKSGKKSLSVSRSNPSFPAKKRVQVPQDILSETPLRGLKLRCSLSRINKEGTQEASTKGKEMEIQSEKHDHVKEPFFWLREEQEGEMLSGRTDEDQIIEGSTPVPPSFSDLKDADDESPTKQAPSKLVIYLIQELGSFSAGITYSTHRALGIALFCLGTLQVFALLLRPNKDHKIRKFLVFLKLDQVEVHSI